MKEYRIAILGNSDVILGFKALGVDTIGLVKDNAAGQLQDAIEKGEYGIVFITEDWAIRLEQVLKEYYTRVLPAIVSVPSPQGATGAALRNLKRIVEQAVGSDILFKNE